MEDAELPEQHTIASDLTERERFRRTLLFDRPDRVPLSPGGPRESTLAAWHRQGLPQGVDWYDYLLQTLGIPHRPHSPTRTWASPSP